MTNITAFLGKPLLFKNKIWVYPPKVIDVVANPRFGTYTKILTITAEDIYDELKLTNKNIEIYPTPFEFLLANCYHSEEFKQLAIGAFNFFCKQEVEFLFEAKVIKIGTVTKTDLDGNEISQIIYLTEDEFFDFQNMIRESMGDKPAKPPEPPNPNEDPRVTEIKRRARERDRIKARQNSKNGISLNTCLASICCMGIGLTPLNIGEMSYCAVGQLMATMQEKEKYDIDIRSLLAGADPKKVKPKYWIRNL